MSIKDIARKLAPEITMRILDGQTMRPIEIRSAGEIAGDQDNFYILTVVQEYEIVGKSATVIV